MTSQVGCLKTTDISKYFVWSPGLWDKESRLYIVNNYPMAKSKPIYQQGLVLNWRKDQVFTKTFPSSCIQSVINQTICKHGVVIYFIMQ